VARRSGHRTLCVDPWLSLQPQAVLKNMARLESLNMLGRFFLRGARLHKTGLPAGQAHATVQSYNGASPGHDPAWRL